MKLLYSIFLFFNLLIACSLQAQYTDTITIYVAAEEATTIFFPVENSTDSTISYSMTFTSLTAPGTTPDWLFGDPSSDDIAAGASTDLIIQFDALNYANVVLEGEIEVTYNESSGLPRRLIYAQMFVDTDGVPVASATLESNACEGTITFDNTTTSTNPGQLDYLWDFGNGVTSTEFEPEYTYPENGMYTVSLTACLGDLCSTVENVATFTVDIGGVCNFYNYNPDAISGVGGCSGQFYDEGGPDGDYTNDNSNWRFDQISVPAGTQARLEVVEFDLNDAGDRVSIYTEDVIEQYRLGTFTQGQLQPGTVFTSPGRNFFIIFETNGSGTAAGFRFDWSCEEFQLDLDNIEVGGTYGSCSGEVIMNAGQSFENVDYTWTFSDGFSATFSEEAEVDYAFTTTGNKTITATLTDEAGNQGSDAITFPLNSSAPLSLNIMGNTTLSPGQTANLSINDPISFSRFFWLTSDGQSGESQFFNPSWDEPGVYQVKVIYFRLQGCPEVGLTEVTVGDPSASTDYSVLSHLATYPNPTQHELNINLSLLQAKQINFLVYDQLGRLVMSQNEYLTSSDHTVKLSLDGLARGTYFLHLVEAGKAKIASRLFTKQ